MRRTPIRRTAPLRRGKPLARGKPLRRSRGSGLPAPSRLAVEVRSQGICELGTPVCTVRAVEVHHLAGRVGPDAHDPSNLAHCCHECHRHAHLNPEESYLRGWLRRRVT